MPSLRQFILVVFLTCAFAGQVMAVGSSGFENASYSPTALGQSNAVVAQGGEPAAISYNPAGIADLKGVQVQSDLHPTSIFTFHKGASGTTRSSGTVVLVPTAYATINPGKILNDRIVVGIGSDAPFGLINKYDSRHPTVRYTGARNWLKMYTLKPTIAAKITDWLSIGGGPIYHRVFDFGQILAYPNALIVPGTADGQIRLEASGNSWGWQLGTIVKPHPKHHVGMFFRSPVHMLVKGSAKVENSAFLRNFETGVHAKLNLPFNMTWGYAFRPNDKTVLEIDFGYTRWSNTKRLYVTNVPTANAFDNIILGALGPSDKDYRDSFSIHVGGKRRITEKLQLMAGSLFYTAAVPKDHFTPSLPDSNRLGFSIGSSYDINRYLAFDLSYFVMLGLRRHIDNAISEVLGTSVDGRYFSLYQVASFAVRLKWESLFTSSHVPDENPVSLGTSEL